MSFEAINTVREAEERARQIKLEATQGFGYSPEYQLVGLSVTMIRSRSEYSSALTDSLVVEPITSAAFIALSSSL